MSKSARLRVCDVHAILKLVGECRDLGDDAEAWRLHWMKETGRLAGGDLMIGGEITVAPDGGLRPVSCTTWGWQNGFDQNVWQTGFLEQPDLNYSPLFEGYFKRASPFDSACLSRKDYLSDRDFERSVYYHSMHRPLGIEHSMLCFVPLVNAARVCSAVTVNRDLRVRRDFSRREKTVVRELSLAIGGLVGGPLAYWDEPSPADLTPRVRQVLECLLEGDSDKQIACRLNIGRFTVNQYTKIIYRHFGVQSRSELMARWIRRAGGVKR